MGVGMLTKEDTRYGAALEGNGIGVEQRGRVRGLRAIPRHSDGGASEKGLQKKRSEQVIYNT